MEFIKSKEEYRVPIKSWCKDIDEGAVSQAEDLAAHEAVFSHVALMPDCHKGYGMPIGGVIACENAVIPNAVGVDIGCGMGAVKTSISVNEPSMVQLREMVNLVKKYVPVGEGKAHKEPQTWEAFEYDINDFKGAGWYNNKMAKLANLNLGTLGGGNHFIEVQAGEDGYIWLMIHSGSRNLGYVIARYYNDLAQKYDKESSLFIPSKDLAYLPADSDEGKDYIRDMTFALSYAKENRRRIMDCFMIAFSIIYPEAKFEEPINIHHNYAGFEEHQGKNVWVHRKGATSAQKDEMGIIPGSMGTPSYIVKGLGNQDSFTSCSHGAGRTMGRLAASRALSKEACDAAMEGIVFDRWSKQKRGKKNGKYDLGEAPQAYKNIEDVINAELDLIKPVVKLKPLAVVKG